MHCPDADGEKKCRTREQQTATGIRCAANPRGEPETSITSQNRDHHRERDEIGIVSFEHDLLGHPSPRMASSRSELIRPVDKLTIRRCDAKWQNPLPTGDIHPYVEGHQQKSIRASASPVSLFGRA